jgi:hypothetical protein
LGGVAWGADSSIRLVIEALVALPLAVREPGGILGELLIGVEGAACHALAVLYVDVGASKSKLADILAWQAVGYFRERVLLHVGIPYAAVDQAGIGIPGWGEVESTAAVEGCGAWGPASLGSVGLGGWVGDGVGAGPAAVGAVL